MRCKPGQTDVSSASGPALAQPREPRLSPVPAELHYFLPVQSSFYRKKKFLKKYKLPLYKIKAPLSGASGRAGSWGRERGRVAQSQLPNFKVFSTVNFDQRILNSLPLQLRGGAQRGSA